ncbi:hypothetical protein [Aneurinibacillus tyrosinisolvens]|nr:hypothetical protein [Aneurinibacillus tyrosinisolvens]
MPPEMLADMLIQTYQGVLTHWCLGCGDDDTLTQMMLSFTLFFDGITKK